MSMYEITRPLFCGMSIVAPFFALNADSVEKVIGWIGYGVIFAILSLMSAVAAKKEK